MPESLARRRVILLLQEYRKSVLIFLIFIVYAGAVFWSNYASLQRLKENALVQLQLETEKQASAISYYFSERREDISGLAESEVVINFFDNRDLGMTYQYGLGVNVQLIEDRFERMVAHKRVSDQAVYAGFMLLDSDGALVAKWNRPENNSPLKEVLDPGNHDIRTRPGSSRGELLISAPIWINQVYRGELLAWIDANTSFAQFGHSPTGGRRFLVDRETGSPLNSGGDFAQLLAQHWHALNELSSNDRGARILLEDGGQKTLAIIKVDIVQMPLSFIDISSDYPGEGSFSRLFLIAVGVIPFIVVLIGIVDIRERRHLEHMREEARTEAVRLAQARSDFLANMSHEIRTPMNAIIGMTELCLGTALNPKQHNYLNKIQRASNSLLRIVNDILDFSKIESGMLEMEKLPFELDHVLDNIGALFSEKAGEKSIELIFDVDDSDTRIFIGDSLRIEQILINLVGNAIKFSERGTIVLRIRSERISENAVQLQFDVIDEGLGISPEQQTRLFTAFSQADTTTTRRFGGTGLGLVICKRLIELMGGEIHVDSVPGQGSTFHCFVCLEVDGSHGSRVHEIRQHLAPHAHRPVLVVDDNPLYRSAIGAQLGQLGLRSDLCASGVEALAAVARPDAPDYLAVVVDFHLPGEDGVAVIRRLRHFWNDRKPPPMILLTNYSHEQELEQVSSVFDGVLSKPTRTSRLFAEIAPFLGIAVRETRPQDMHSAVNLGALNGLDLLLVDDVPLNQEVVRDMLEGAGMRVRLANNGREAIDAIAQRVPDGVLMDCQMPVMDGYEATRALRADERYRTLTIIAFTANALPSEQERCLEAGMNAYITKPVKSSDLFAVLLAHLPLRVAGQVAVAAETTRRDGTDSLPVLPGIDTQLGLHYASEKTDLYRRLLRLFNDTHGRQFGAGFRAAFDGGNWDEATRLVHSLKSSARMIGAVQLGEHSNDLEEVCHRRQGDEVLPHLDRLLQELERVCGGLSEIGPG